MAKRSDQRIQFLNDLFVSVVEDYGTNTWRQISGGTYRHVVGEERATILELEFNEDGSSREHEITVETLVAGLTKIAAGQTRIADNYRSRILEANCENDAGIVDAYDADIVLQAGMLGEVVYG